MKHIFEYINEAHNDVAYVTRSLYGSWTIALKKDGTFTNRQIMSHQKLTDEDIKELKDRSIPFFDFYNNKETFRESLIKMRMLNRSLCM